MEYNFYIRYSREESCTVEADSFEEAKKLLDYSEFYPTDKDYMTESFATDEDGEEIEWKAEVE